MALSNPTLPGSYQFDTVVYGAPPLAYPATLSQYVIYSTPSPGYTTSRINISAFANLGGGATWPFTATNVPLNGHICIPRGRGPFPLAVFVHGNHNPLENSTPGYLYLCSMLASQGVIAATIDANFLNGFNFGENDARAIVHLEHLKQFRAWNNTAAHPLHGKVDLNRIMIVGHSRGGEGVGHASLFNRLPGIGAILFDGSTGFGPYRFNLSCVCAIAPTDGQFVPPSGATVVPDNYFIIHGSRDADVSNFQGYHIYERAHGVDLANPTVSNGKFKTMAWVHRANHNQFNSIWASETGPGVAMPPADQELIAKVYIGSLAQATLLGQPDYLEVLKDHALARPWLPEGSDLITQYMDPVRFFVQHNQEGTVAPVVSLPGQGSVLLDNVTAARQLKLLVPGSTTTITLRLAWTNPTPFSSRMILTLDPSTLPAERYRVLALRVGQSNEAGNQANRDQDFTLEVSSGSRTLAIPASALHRILYPDSFDPSKVVMQTLRLPVEKLVENGVDPADLRSIAFVFNQRPSGVIYAGDVQFSN